MFRPQHIPRAFGPFPPEAVDTAGILAAYLGKEQ
jgi:hypothetical protein